MLGESGYRTGAEDRVPCARGRCVRSNAEGVIPVSKAAKIVGGAFVAVLFVAAVWFIYAAESEATQGDMIDVKVLYGSLVFTLFVSSAIFLATSEGKSPGFEASRA